MELENLSADEKNLVNTQFPPELEKEAQAQVAELKECVDAGVKLAASYADEFDTLIKKADDEKGETEEEEEHEKKLKDEHKKEASAKAAFIARGYINELLKLGEERHQNPMYYVGPAVAEKLAAMGKESAVQDKVMGFLRQAGSKASEHAGKAGAKAKELAGKAHAMAKEHPRKAMAGGAALAGGVGYGAYRGLKKKD